MPLGKLASNIGLPGFKPQLGFQLQLLANVRAGRQYMVTQVLDLFYQRGIFGLSSLLWFLHDCGQAFADILVMSYRQNICLLLVPSLYLFQIKMKIQFYFKIKQRGKNGPLG